MKGRSGTGCGANAGSAAGLRIVSRIGAIPAPLWDACAGAENPFLGHGFLSALEDSGSAVARRGWQAQHLVLDGPDGGIDGVVPLYLKSHSYGEYVFDHGWSAAYERAGGAYFPKLLSAVPFTPVTGPRLLIRPGAPDGTAARLIQAMQALVADNGLSSAHVTFPTRADWDRFGAEGWLQRVGCQFHWENQGYRHFDDFLAALNSRKRKAIRKERRVVAESGVRLFTLTGADLKDEHWDAFYQFYMDTSDRKWGSAYLTRDFFFRLGATLPERVVLVMAWDGRDWVAGALNLLGTDTLYGRNWGCTAQYKHLHFEACYYRAIDFAIEHGLKRVEAGAQGEHKIQRGYLPTPTYSAHWIREPSFRRAIEDFLERERPHIEAQMAVLAEDSPFRQGEDGP